MALRTIQASVCEILCVYRLTTRSFVLYLDVFLQGATDGIHLTLAGIGLSVGATHRVRGLEARIQALAHGLAVLHHARAPELTLLLQTWARRVQIWVQRDRSEHDGWRKARMRGREGDDKGRKKADNSARGRKVISHFLLLDSYFCSISIICLTY